jgi:hypothetical protein
VQSYRNRVISDKLRQTLIRGIKRTVAAAGLGGVVLAAAVPAPAQAVVAQSPDPGPWFDGTVWAVAYAGDTIYIGGDFTYALVNGRRIPRARLAAVDADTGALTPWAPEANGRVKALAVSGSAVYAAGDFSSVNGLSRDSVAKLDAVHGTVAPFKHSVSGRPYALAAGSGRLYMGGAFTAVDGATRTRLAAFSLSSGALDSGWKPAADDQVETLVATSGRIYVGGKFHKIAGATGYDRLAALSPSSGAVDSGFKPRATYITYGIAVTGTSVYAAHGGQGGRTVAYSTSGATRWKTTFDGDPQALSAIGDTVYVGGHFDNVCKTSRTGDQGVCLDGSVSRIKLAALGASTGTLRSWTANANGIEGVLSMTTDGSRFAAGGAFTMINGRTQRRFAQFS